MGWTTLLTSTESGRATKVRIRPAATASPIVDRVIRPGESSRPSITNRPIWASQAMPSGEGPGGGAVRQLAVAEDQRRDVDRGEAAAVDGGRAAVRQEGQAEHGDRVEARGGQRDPAQDPGAAEAEQPGRRATPTASSRATVPTISATPCSCRAPERDQRDQDDGGGVVEPRLGLERARQAAGQGHGRAAPRTPRPRRWARSPPRAGSPAPRAARAGSATRRRPRSPTPRRRASPARHRAASPGAPRASWW